jgi:hypothetical protein
MDEMKALKRLGEAARRDGPPPVDVAARVRATIAGAEAARTQYVWAAAAAVSLGLAAAVALWALSLWWAAENPIRAMLDPVSVGLS